MTLKIFGVGLVAIGLALLVVAILWRLYLGRHDEQLLATRVVKALHAIGGRATAHEIRRRIHYDYETLEDLEDIKWNLELMAAEGTVRSEMPDTTRGEWPARIYTLTPRFEGDTAPGAAYP